MQYVDQRKTKRIGYLDDGLDLYGVFHFPLCSVLCCAALCCAVPYVYSQWPVTEYLCNWTLIYLPRLFESKPVNFALNDINKESITCAHFSKHIRNSVCLHSLMVVKINFWALFFFSHRQSIAFKKVCFFCLCDSSRSSVDGEGALKVCSKLNFQTKFQSHKYNNLTQLSQQD